MVMPRADLWIATAAVAAAALLVLAWPAPELAPVGAPGQSSPQAPAAASAARAAAERLAAAARLCADGCDALPSSPGDDSGDGRAGDPAEAMVAAAEPPSLPAELDDWALHPDAVPVRGVAPVVVRLHNLAPEPDDLDATPADESEPAAPPVDASTGE